MAAAIDIATRKKVKKLKMPPQYHSFLEAENGARVGIHPNPTWAIANAQPYAEKLGATLKKYWELEAKAMEAEVMVDEEKADNLHKQALDEFRQLHKWMEKYVDVINHYEENDLQLLPKSATNGNGQ